MDTFMTVHCCIIVVVLLYCHVQYASVECVTLTYRITSISSLEIGKIRTVKQ